MVGGGALAAALIGLVAWRVRALTLGGALAAFVVGTLTFAAGGWGAALILLLFFGTSIVLSRVKSETKKGLVDIGKTGPRDGWQVLANGGWATLAILVWRFVHVPDAAVWFVAFAGAYAAATADTWGTEIGTLWHGLPRDVLTGREVTTGLSGGVSTIGTFAEAMGAGIIGLMAWPALVLSTLALDPHPVLTLTTLPRPYWTHNAVAALALPVALGGMLGAIVDSLLGATVQERRWCPSCVRDCETRVHVCGTATLLRRGLPWISNDVVNAAATFTGGALAAVSWLAQVGR